MRKFVLALLSIALLASCQKTSERSREESDATGKGNGGNTLSLSKTDIEEIFATLKPKLKSVFEALSYLVAAEKLAPGSTDLNDQPELAQALAKMVDDKGSKNVFVDLKTEGNLALQDEPCIDHRGVANAAAAVINEVGGKICFSAQKIQSTSIRSLENAGEIAIIGLAVHEFVHHHVASGDTEADEKIAQSIQNYVEQRLASVVELSKITANDGIISINETSYLERFKQEASDLLNSVGEQESL